MKIYGFIAYGWHGDGASALAAPSKRPTVIIDLLDEWVQVSRIEQGTALVDWADVRELRGWAPVPAEDQQDSGSGAGAQDLRGNDAITDCERPRCRPTSTKKGHDHG